MGNIYDDGKVYDENNNHIGYRTPNGEIINKEYEPIGWEDVKGLSAQNMFVPAGTFGNGNAYGIGNKPSSLGPGGGYGAGERYDPNKAAALANLQATRRSGMAVGSISSNVSPSTFTGYEEDGWPDMGEKTLSSWRVDMSQMILEDKPIPAVLARSVYASDGLGSGIPVTAIVERNVYAEEGRNIVIPAGSRVIGEIGGESSGSSGGNSGGAVKIDISWKRLIRPDGSQFKIDGSQTADAQGRAGAIGYLDEQLLKKYTAPMLITAMESATAYLMASGNGTSEGNGYSTTSSKSQAATDARQNFLDQMDEIFKEIINKKADIQAVTYVPAGTRIIIFPKVDLWLNNPDRAKKNKSETTGKDELKGLAMKNPENFEAPSSVSTNEDYDENIRPTGGNRSSSSKKNNNNSRASRRQQQLRAEQQQRMQQGQGPAEIQQIETSTDDDIPSLL